MASNKHVNFFEQNKMKSGETVLSWIKGYTGVMMGQGRNAQKNGAIIITNQRVCFVQKGMFGETFEKVELSKISSIEHRSQFGFRELYIHTANNEIGFKTFEKKQPFNTFFDMVEDALEQARNLEKTSNNSGSDDTGDLGKLTKLKALLDAGAISAEEFAQKKADILSRI